MQNNIWFTSDTHYNHKNIVRGTTSWKFEDYKGDNQHDSIRTRNFDTLQQHNDALVENFNSVVKEDDILYHLGDWSFGGQQSIKEFRDRLNCKNIHLIYGNHDEHIENKEEYQKLFSSVNHYKEVSYAKKRFVLSHYAMRVWNKSHHGSIMLYGHSHGTLDEMTPNIANPTWIGDQYFIKNYRTMDVGVDTNSLFPYHIDEILDIMNTREISLEVDHHNKNTN